MAWGPVVCTYEPDPRRDATTYRVSLHRSHIAAFRQLFSNPGDHDHNHNHISVDKVVTDQLGKPGGGRNQG